MNDTTAQPVPPEVAGLFIDEPAPEGKGADPAPAAAAAAQEWIGAVEMGASMLCAMKPALASVWTTTRRAQLGEAVAKVAAKYNWQASALFERYAAEISLAFVAVPLLLETRAVLAADAARQDEPPPAADQPAPRPEPAATKGPALAPNTGQ